MVSSLLIVILYSAYKTPVSVHMHINSKGGGSVRVSRVWQLIRRVIHESILLAFSAFALWPAIAPADEGGPYVLRGPFAHVEPSQWYDSAQDSAPDQDDALAGTRSTVGEHADLSPARRAHPGTWIGTPGDVCAQGQLPFLTPYRGRAPPWKFFSSLGTTLFANSHENGGCDGTRRVHAESYCHRREDITNKLLTEERP